MNLRHLRLIFLWILFSSKILNAKNTDTLKLTLEQADSMFLHKNFALLAQKFQISSDHALIQQSKLWPNPTFNVELSMHSISKPKFLDIGSNGQQLMNIEQVIQIAGQRNKYIKLAQLNANYSEAIFAELIRTLKFQLRSNFFNLLFKKQTLSILSEQEIILKDIIAGYRKADSNGSVAHADFVRLLALQLNLKNDYLSVLKEVLEAQQEFQQLLGITAEVNPLMELQSLIHYSIAQHSLFELLENAKQDRPNIKMGLTEVSSSKAQYNLQKSLAVPDLHIGAVYEKQGYVNNYIGITAGIDLPFWNRNQGNIKAARFQIKQSNTLLDQQLNIVESEVKSAFQKVIAYEQSFLNSDLKAFDNDYKLLMQQVAQNFTKGNINMLQFIDYFDSYSSNAKDLNEYYSSLYTAYEELSLSVGKDIYQP